MDKVDVPINEVGMAGSYATMASIINEDGQTTLQVNVTGKFESIEPDIRATAWSDPAGTQLNIQV